MIRQLTNCIHAHKTITIELIVTTVIVEGFINLGGLVGKLQKQTSSACHTLWLSLCLKALA
jgi:hypothetical protein